MLELSDNSRIWFLYTIKVAAKSAAFFILIQFHRKGSMDASKKTL